MMRCRGNSRGDAFAVFVAKLPITILVKTVVFTSFSALEFLLLNNHPVTQVISGLGLYLPYRYSANHRPLSYGLWFGLLVPRLRYLLLSVSSVTKWVLRWFFTPFGASGPSSLLKLSRPWPPPLILLFNHRPGCRNGLSGFVLSSLGYLLVCFSWWHASRATQVIPAWLTPYCYSTTRPGCRTVVGLVLFPLQLGIPPWSVSLVTWVFTACWFRLLGHRIIIVTQLFWACSTPYILQLLCPGCTAVRVFVPCSLRYLLVRVKVQPFPWFGLH
jgi:hypothetical protein